ncbi:hypothetical protein [Deferrisoma camini]|uniref:hypothetical protein n=1 Tax=Deferrisoma camini TaxID=1035120 RepID=UPI00046C8CBA|nr:hypothetical protein [Deferrisoma camini]
MSGTGRRPASFALLFYYFLLLVSTAAANGSPYPFFAWVFEGTAARIAVVLDCLVLIHIVVGVLKAQRLTWWILLVYNAVQLASVAVGLWAWPMDELALAFGFEDATGSLVSVLAVSALAMAVATAYAWRLRDAFWDENPYLF